jgi:hypothetical protein
MFVFLSLLVASTAYAAPIELTYQGRLLDSSGEPLNTPTTVTVTLHGPSGVVHTEEFTSVTVVSGYFTVILGSSSALEADLFLSPPLEVELSSGSTFFGRTPFVSVGHAGVADVTRRVIVEGAAAPGSCTEDGQIAWDTTLNTLRVCIDRSWRTGSDAPDGVVLTETNGQLSYSDGSAAPSCAEYAQPGLGYAAATSNGAYDIEVAGVRYPVYCDIDRGGLTFTTGAVANNGPTLIDAACSGPFVPFRAASLGRIRALEDYANDNGGTSAWWFANLVAGPVANCTGSEVQVGWLPTSSSWSDSNVNESSDLPNLNITGNRNCPAGTFDPIPVNATNGVSNRGCGTCLYNNTEVIEAGRVACGLPNE